MAIKFHAEMVDCSQEDWLWCAVWGAEESIAEDHYLMLQRAELAQKDRDMGFEDEGVYIECCGQGWSWNEHIVSFELLRDRVRVVLDAKAQAEMHNDGLIEVTFDLDDESFSAWSNGLAHIFLGKNYYKPMAS
jgi:hypothetical protein